jgi:hypothetical protein
VLHGWIRVQGRDGLCYQINMNHEALGSLLNSLEKQKRGLLESILKALESTFPADALYADMASDRPQHYDDPSAETLRELAIRMVEAIQSAKGNASDLLQNLHTIEPFSDQPLLAIQIAKELGNVE